MFPLDFYTGFWGVYQGHRGGHDWSDLAAAAEAAVSLASLDFLKIILLVFLICFPLQISYCETKNSLPAFYSNIWN